MKNVFATALFCDEIRREDNGKEILLGIYTGGMNVPELPYTQGSFWVQVGLYSSIEDPAGLKAIRLIFPDGHELEAEISAPRSAAMKASDGGPQFSKITGNLRLRPITLLEEGRLQVWAITDTNEKVYAGSLGVALASDGIIDVSNSLKSIRALSALYQELAEKLGRSRGSLAIKIMDSLKDHFGESKLPSDGSDFIFVQLNQREADIYYRSVYKKPPKVAVEFEPDTAKLRTRNRDRFGFRVVRGEGEEAPQRMSVKIDSRD